MSSVRFTFTLDAVKDMNLIRWLNSQSNISAAIREALKAYLEKPTNAELAMRLDKVLNAIQMARLVTPAIQTQEGEQGEPAIAVKGFEKMFQRFKD